MGVVEGSASVFGFSSGATLALKAAADGLPVERLYMYEPPFRFSEEEPALPADLPSRLQAMLDQGDRGAVVATSPMEGRACLAPCRARAAGPRELPWAAILSALKRHL